MKKTLSILLLSFCFSLSAQEFIYDLDTSLVYKKELRDPASRSINDIHFPYPTIFIHGLNGDHDSWDDYTDLIHDGGWSSGGILSFCLNASSNSTSIQDDVSQKYSLSDIAPADFYIINFDDDCSSESNQASIAKQGHALSIAIGDVINITGRNKVILMGHSMGGLCAREYIQNPDLWIEEDINHHVAKLITSGTPHGGSNMGSGIATTVLQFAAAAVQAAAQAAAAVANAGWGILSFVVNVVTLGNVDIGPPPFPNDPLGILEVYVTSFDFRSEAIRDLKISYLNDTSGTYLFGGNEDNYMPTDNILGPFYNTDINSDGDEDDLIIGLNQKDFPSDIVGQSIIGVDEDILQSLFYLGTDLLLSGLANINSSSDGIVSGTSANLVNYVNSPNISNSKIITSSKHHKNLTKDLIANFSSLDEPSFSSYEVEINNTYYAHTNPKGETDIDKFIFEIKTSGNFKIDVHSIKNPDGLVKIIDKQSNTIIFESESSYENETLSSPEIFIQPGFYEIIVESETTNTSNQLISSNGYLIHSDDVSYPDSYYFETEFEEYCPYENLSIVLNDSYGDGWNGSEIYFNSTNFTLESGYVDTVSYCFNNEECLIISTTEDDYPDEVSWEIIDSQENILESGGTEFFGNIGYCENQSDCDQLLNFEIITGNNFDTINWTVTDENDIEVYSSNNQSYDDNSSYMKYLCLTQGNEYSLNFEYSGDQSTTSVFSIQNNECTILIDSLTNNEQFNFDMTCVEEEIIYGCNDNNAFNYNYFATVNDDTCIPKIYGCTDESAPNYVEPSGDIYSDVNTDDGNCLVQTCENILISQTPGEYPSEISWHLVNQYTGIDLTLNQGDLPENGFEQQVCMIPGCTYVIQLTDSWGDGWNGSVLTIGNQTFTLDVGFTNVPDLWVDPLIPFCISPQEAEDYEILDCYGNLAPESWFGDSSCDDGSYYHNGVPIYFNCFSFNYDGMHPDCVTYGCTDENAINFNPEATHWGGSSENACQYLTEGCTDILACNFDETIDIDDGSCVYPENEFDCNGNCINDSDGDGICDENEIVGCQDQAADNYNENSTDPDYCEYIGCMDSSYIEYDAYANSSNPSDCLTPIIEGCLDVNYIEYNTSANISNSNMCINIIIEGCTNTESYNYNQNANTDDNSCEIVSYGCINQEALNFNSLANTDNNTCLFPILGCIDNGLTFEDFFDNITLDEIPDGLDDDYKYDVNGDNLPALNFNPLANVNDGSCITTIYGCTDVSSLNYNINANSDDNTCIPIIFGCMDNNADNYHSSVNSDDGSCEYQGCTDPNANNYNTQANIDNNSCTYSTIGCMDSLFLEYNAFANTSDPTACLTIILAGCTELNSINYNNSANLDDGSCIEIIEGCTDLNAFNYDADATVDDGSCIALVEGCTNAAFTEYDVAANTDNGTCLTAVLEGCTNLNYTEYYPDANTDDGSCVTYIVSGCTDSAYTEFSADANTDNETCVTLVVEGCTNLNSTNYDANANTDVGSCIAIAEGCTDAAFTEYDAAANTDDGSCETLVVEGCINISYTEYDAAANTDDGSCSTLVVEGCTAILYIEYNAAANNDDGSCSTLVVLGCMNFNADNYTPFANTDDGSCLSSTQELPEEYCLPESYIIPYTNYITRFVIDTLDSGYNPTYSQSNPSYTDNSEFTVSLEAGSSYSIFCQINSQGTQQGWSGNIGLDILIDYNRDGDFSDENEICYSNSGVSLGNQANSVNYSGNINIPTEIVNGHTKIRIVTYLTSEYPLGSNYGCISGYIGEIEDYTAILISDIEGCTDLIAENYNPNANIENGTCDYLGCTNLESINYDSNATIDDYSCVLSTEFNNYDIFLQPFPRYEPIEWSPYGGTTDQILEDYGTSNGAENTENIVEFYGTEEEYAASYCYNLDLYGFTDWYLPSSDELGAFSNYFATDWSVLNYYSNTEITSWNNSPNPTIGGIFNQPDWTGVYYWTSNESNQEGNANLKKINPSSLWNDDKSSNHPVRCVRNNAIEGCTDASAQNFNQFASIENGTCNYYPNCQIIILPEGWSMFSSYIITEDMSMTNILNPIVENVIITKNNAGQAYLIEWNFNGIGNMLVGQGYQIKTNAISEFNLCGSYAIPNENIIELIAGWNMIGYLRIEPEYADIILQEINSSGNLMIAKDYMGSAYLPEWNFNGIGFMMPGQGYQIKVIIPDTLQY